MDHSPQNITRLLQAAGAGDVKAEESLLRAVYEELRVMAKSRMARSPAEYTLQATALVHEAFLKLVGPDKDAWENRAHFFFAASRAMRDILVDRARAKASLKRGGGRRRVDLEKLVVATDAPDEDLLALDGALLEFQPLYPWEHRIVMMRFFAGLTNNETAQALGVSLRSIERDLRFARAWLRETLIDGENKAAD